MNDTGERRFQGESGASLILVVAFMVIIGAISAAVISTTGSGLQGRVALDQARNREYAADAAIEAMIATARELGGDCPASMNSALNGVSIHVDCSPAFAVVVGPDGILIPQQNLAFAACEGATCASATPIINAQVNFRGGTPAQTFVQAWSVNR